MTEDDIWRIAEDVARSYIVPRHEDGYPLTLMTPYERHAVKGGAMLAADAIRTALDKREP